MAVSNDILRQVLIDQGEAESPTTTATPGRWVVVAGPTPNTPNAAVRAIGIQDTGGFVEPGAIQRTGDRVVFPSVQVRVRAENVPTASNKCVDIITLLNKVGIPTVRGGLGQLSVPVNEKVYRLTAARTVDEPMFLKEEESNRQVYVFNVRLTYTLEAA